MLVIKTSVLFIYEEYRAKFCNKEAVVRDADVKFDITSRNNETNISLKKGKSGNPQKTAYLQVNIENSNNFYALCAFY